MNIVGVKDVENGELGPGLCGPGVEDRLPALDEVLGAVPM